MTRIAIVGGGIAGLAAAYQCHKLGLDWHLFEATARLGGTVATTRIETPAGSYVLEDGPDGWVTDKPWAQELAIELGLTNDLLLCNEAQRRTLILIDSHLQPMPPGMRMMVPEDLTALADSPLFTPAAREAYAAELANASQLRETAPQHDESVATFVLRHFGPEVLDRIAAPLLSGVFGGDVHKLSVRAVMPAFVKMEQEHGSLIAALQAKARQRGPGAAQPTFTTLRHGMASLVEAIVATLPPERIHLNAPALSLKREGKLWCLRTANPGIESHKDGSVTGKSKRHVQHVLLATPPHVTRSLLSGRHPEIAALLPTEASSAVLATFCWPAAAAASINLPTGFGFLVPAPDKNSHPDPDPDPEQAQRVEGEGPASRSGPQPLQLLACTFAHEKYPDRAPAGAKVLRTFFGGASAAALTAQPDAAIAAEAYHQLQAILGPLPPPTPALTTVRRWPRSLPQYEVGHLDRMAQLDERLTQLPGLTLLGNAYRGVGVPDLIQRSREAIRTLAQKLSCR